MSDYGDGLCGMRIRDFDIKHGGDGIRIGEWIVYSDGATREPNPLGGLIEPHPDPRVRFPIRIKYQEELLRRAVGRFDDYKSKMARCARINLNERQCVTAPPCSEAEVVQILKTLQAQVKTCKGRLEEVRREFEENKPDWLRHHEAGHTEIRTLNENFLSALKTVEI
jgi:hypothetical protein